MIHLITHCLEASTASLKSRFRTSILHAHHTTATIPNDERHDVTPVHRVYENSRQRDSYHTKRKREGGHSCAVHSEIHDSKRRESKDRSLLCLALQESKVTTERNRKDSLMALIPSVLARPIASHLSCQSSCCEAIAWHLLYSFWCCTHKERAVRSTDICPLDL